MKNLTSKITYLAAAAALVLATGVQAQSMQLKAKIPFAFTAGKEFLPSGDYRISVDAMFHRVVLSAPNGEQRFLGVSTPLLDTSGSGTVALVFNRYGERYFLHRITNLKGGGGMEWSPSRAEKEIARSGGGVEVAVALGGTN